MVVAALSLAVVMAWTRQTSSDRILVASGLLVFGGFLALPVFLMRSGASLEISDKSVRIRNVSFLKHEWTIDIDNIADIDTIDEGECDAWVLGFDDNSVNLVIALKESIRAPTTTGVSLWGGLVALKSFRKIVPPHWVMIKEIALALDVDRDELREFALDIDGHLR